MDLEQEWGLFSFSGQPFEGQGPVVGRGMNVQQIEDAKPFIVQNQEEFWGPDREPQRTAFGP